jgi:competence protein ComEC
MAIAPEHIVPVWRKAPFLRLVVPVIFGIIIAAYVPAHKSWVYGGSILALVLFIIAHFNALRHPFFYGVSHFIFWAAFAMVAFQFNKVEDRADFIGSAYSEGALVAATIISPIEPKPKSFRAEASISQWDSAAKQWRSLSGGVILYFDKDSLPEGLGMGSRIAFKKPLQPIRSSGNPGSFDYQEYAATKGWFFQVYLKHKEFVIDKVKINPGLRAWPIAARDHLLATLRRNIPDAQTLGVAEALLTGYRGNMDKELSWEYAGTGVAHIIAISGLHLGMIQAGLLFLLAPLAKIRHGKNIRALMVIVLLWVFTFITGAGPSVLRSALMFTILLFGEVIGRKGNSYNSLLASAFMLLLVNPNVLFDVGFQLSYSAVLSIFMFSAPIGRWIQTGNKWIDKTWQLFSVTLAAQILTLPFVVFYFNQFPVYFLLANFVAIPLSWVALNLSLILTLFLFWIPPVAALLGKGIHISIEVMNRCITWIHHLPMSRIENIYLPLPQAIILMVMIGFLSAWFLLRHKGSAVAALAGLVIFISYREVVWQQRNQQRKLIVYNIAGHTAIDIIAGHRVAYWGDLECLTDPNLYRMHIQPARILFQARDTAILPRDTTGFQLVKAGEKTLVVLDKEPDTRRSAAVQADILLLSANIRTKPAWILEKLTCRQIVAGTQLPFYRIPQWQITADSLHLRLHPVAEKGAFILDL